jgi:hypothetical protein
MNTAKARILILIGAVALIMAYTTVASAAPSCRGRASDRNGEHRYRW